ncbi:MAG: hypothetical protein R2874_10290 [Desulfobacterales bacterium]
MKIQPTPGPAGGGRSAEGLWFTEKSTPPAEIRLTVYDGEINTDDFFPAGQAWSRPDIPHALSMLASSTPDNTMETIDALKKNRPSRLWGMSWERDLPEIRGQFRDLAFGEDIPHVCPNK